MLLRLTWYAFVHLWSRIRLALIACVVQLASWLSRARAPPCQQDEYVGLPRDHPESYHSFMWNNFFNHIDIIPSNIHILDGNAGDGSEAALVDECAKYERAIASYGGIHLFLGGIGPGARQGIWGTERRQRGCWGREEAGGFGNSCAVLN